MAFAERRESCPRDRRVRESMSESEARSALRRVADCFSAADEVDYDFILQPVAIEEGQSNWVAAATATIPWRATRLEEYQSALHRQRSEIPLIDWSCVAPTVSAMLAVPVTVRDERGSARLRRFD
jgi:hypothetical protein